MAHGDAVACGVGEGAAVDTHLRDRHFTMILWPQCSLGTSGREHLSTASS